MLLLSASCVSLACSGEAFRFAGIDGPDATDDNDFSDTVPRDNLGDAELPGDIPADITNDAGAETSTPIDSEPDPDPEPPSVCGPLRENDPLLANGEVCIPEGSFVMGSSAAGLGAGYVSHSPEHTVGLSAYVLDAYEVSVGRYRACVSAGLCAAPSTTLAQGCTYTSDALDHEQYPVTCVTWQAAQDFCGWDAGRRLPTEAEWERAARGANSQTYSWGSVFDCSRAVLGGASQCPVHAGASPKAAGATPSGASAEGAFDLIGNASEWVADWFGAYSSDSSSDPTGPATGSTRIQRGGNWQTRAVDAVGYARRAEAPAAVGAFSFRCARSAP